MKNERLLTVGFVVVSGSPTFDLLHRSQSVEGQSRCSNEVEFANGNSI